mgnify:CR=1 FL=1
MGLRQAARPLRVRKGQDRLRATRQPALPPATLGHTRQRDRAAAGDQDLADCLQLFRARSAFEIGIKIIEKIEPAAHFERFLRLEFLDPGIGFDLPGLFGHGTLLRKILGCLGQAVPPAGTHPHGPGPRLAANVSLSRGDQGWVLTSVGAVRLK